MTTMRQWMGSKRMKKENKTTNAEWRAIFFIFNMQQLIQEAPLTQLVLKSSPFRKSSGIIPMRVCVYMQTKTCCISWKCMQRESGERGRELCFCQCRCGKYLIMPFFFRALLACSPVNDNSIHTHMQRTRWMHSIHIILPINRLFILTENYFHLCY